MVESASKGAVLLWSKELIKDSALSLGIGYKPTQKHYLAPPLLFALRVKYVKNLLRPTLAGFLAGAGGGICQVTVMGPCTFLVTAVVTSKGDMSTSQRIKSVWAKVIPSFCLFRY